MKSHQFKKPVVISVNGEEYRFTDLIYHPGEEPQGRYSKSPSAGRNAEVEWSNVEKISEENEDWVELSGAEERKLWKDLHSAALEYAETVLLESRKRNYKPFFESVPKNKYPSYGEYIRVTLTDFAKYIKPHSPWRAQQLLEFIKKNNKLFNEYGEKIMRDGGHETDTSPIDLILIGGIDHLKQYMEKYP